ncbi:MAG: hypothetical protein KF901_18755 [Myxococcales bacterium]|nr:hypothetical protein [Myxococcales bacterium]
MMCSAVRVSYADPSAVSSRSRRLSDGYADCRSCAANGFCGWCDGVCVNDTTTSCEGIIRSPSACM